MIEIVCCSGIRTGFQFRLSHTPGRRSFVLWPVVSRSSKQGRGWGQDQDAGLSTPSHESLCGINLESISRAAQFREKRDPSPFALGALLKDSWDRRLSQRSASESEGQIRPVALSPLV